MSRLGAASGLDESRPSDSGVDPLTGTSVAARGVAEAFGEAFADSARWERRADIGAGGMGQVAIMYDRRLGRELAVKTPATAADCAHLVREAAVTAGLEHPGIVSVYDSGESSTGVPWFAMRLVRGRSLASLIDDARTPAERMRLVRHVLAAAEAVAFAHARGVVHRDLKPANVMIGAFGETQVIDWGLALAPGVPSLDAGRAGTPSAMSPEQARGEPVDARADVWALGAMLRHVVTGWPLIGPDESREATLERLAQARIPPLAGAELAPELLAIVQRAMAPRASERYLDAKELADDLARFLDGRRVTAHSYTPLELLRRLLVAARIPLLIAGIGLVAVALVIVIAFARITDERDRSEERLAVTLVAEARRALASDARAPAEILARAAFERMPAEARGVLMALPVARPERRALGRLVCAPSDVADLGAEHTRVVCRDGAGVMLLDDGVVRWGVSGPSDAALLIDGGQVVLVAHDADVETFAAADGQLLGRRAASCIRTRLEHGADDTSAFGIGGACATRVRRDTTDVVPTELCTGALIRAAALSHDGDGWAVVCDDGALVVGRFAGDAAATAASARRVEAGLPVSPHAPLSSSLAFESAERVLVGNDSGELWRIDVTPGAVVAAGTDPRETLRIGRGLVRDIVVAPDGASAVVVLDSEAPSVVDLARWTSLGRLPMDRVTLRPRFAFGADGRFLRAQTQLERWDFRAVRAREVTFANGLSALAVSADGRYAAVGAGGAVALVDTEARQIMATHRWQDNIVKTCAFGPGTSLAASGLGAVAAQRFDPLAPTPPFRNERALRRLGVLADGSGLGVDFTRAVVRMWTDRPEAPIADLAGIDMAVSANGREALVVDADRALWRAHDLHAGGGFERLVVDPAVVDVAIDDAGVAYVASADGIRCFDADGGEGPRRATPDADLVVVAAAADLVAAGAKDGSVRVWKVGEVEPWAILRDHDMRADTLVIEPRGRWLASGAWDGRLHFLRRPDDLGATSLGEAEAAWGTSLGALLARR